MSFPHGETVTRLRPGTRTDRNGNTQPDPKNPTSTAFEGCAVWPGAMASQLLADRDLTTCDYVVAFPASSDIKTTDQLTIRGATCDVEGIPFDYRSPFTGWAPGLIVQANLAKG